MQRPRLTVTETGTRVMVPPLTEAQAGAPSCSHVTPHGHILAGPHTPHVCKMRDVHVSPHWFYYKIRSDIGDPWYGTECVTTTPPHGRATLRELRKHCGLMGTDPQDRKLPSTCAVCYHVNGGEEEARALVSVHAVSLGDMSQL